MLLIVMPIKLYLSCLDFLWIDSVLADVYCPLHPLVPPHVSSHSTLLFFLFQKKKEKKNNQRFQDMLDHGGCPPSVTQPHLSALPIRDQNAW